MVEYSSKIYALQNGIYKVLVNANLGLSVYTSVPDDADEPYLKIMSLTKKTEDGIKDRVSAKLVINAGYAGSSEVVRHIWNVESVLTKEEVSAQVEDREVLSVVVAESGFYHNEEDIILGYMEVVAVVS